MRTLFVDYNRVGHAEVFTVPLLRGEREGLTEGQIVEVGGGDVEPRQARVERVHGASVTLRLTVRTTGAVASSLIASDQ